MSAPVTTGSGVRFTLNGVPVELDVPRGARLLDVLRLRLGASGTKEGCGEGECGACSVIVDGEVVDSCLVPVCQVDGRNVLTVEGLARGSALDPLQSAFLERGAVQCGLCIPGMLMAARAWLDDDGHRDGSTDSGVDAAGHAGAGPAIREAIAGNLCRCTGYTKIVEAIEAAAETWSDTGPPTRALSRSGATAWRPTPPEDVAAALLHGPEIVTPPDLPAALDLLADGPRTPIAGGTDVMVALAIGALPAGARLVDLSRLEELRRIRIEGRALVVGALATFTDLRRSHLVAELLPTLAEVASAVGAAQIQNRGTLGGNIVNASPAGDALPLLLATDAAIVLESHDRGPRAVPASQFWTGYRRTVRAADELVTEVRFPLVPHQQVRFRKIAGRRAQAISKVEMAVGWRETDGRWEGVRIGLGSVAERPIRAPLTERLLEGARPTTDLADVAAESIAAEVRPIDDVRSTADYRRAVTGRALRRIILNAREG
jgi:xanthine dehydrogenase small subunit